MMTALDDDPPDPLALEDATDLIERRAKELDGTPKSYWQIAVSDDLVRARAKRLALLIRQAAHEEAAEARTELALAASDVELANAPLEELQRLSRELHGRSRAVLSTVLESARKPAPERHWIEDAFRPIGPHWLEEPPPAREWILHGSNGKPLLERGIVALFVAPGGRGKTMALCDLAISVATGTAWLGAIEVVAPQRVLLLLAEETTAEVRRRLYNTAHGRGLTQAQRALAAEQVVGIGGRGRSSVLAHVAADGSVSTTPAYEALRRELSRGEPTLVILDPLSRIAPNAESDNASATLAVTLVESLALASRSSVIVAHHTSKSSRKDGGSGDLASAARGVTGLVDAARLVLEITGKSEEDLFLEVTKRNAVPEHHKLPLVRSESGVLRALSRLEREQAGHAIEEAARAEDVRVDELVEELVAAVRKRGSVPGGQRALRELVSGAIQLRVRAIAKALADGRIVGGGRSPYRAAAEQGELLS
jgi:hypothetical protein